ncbi:hypothetical protein [Chelativorans sp.]|uniref:hypothetical protein n=1 Tax=Chelativorans sp. TaxID=2203393 RepID=UPI002811E55A|nr:hypothetical protein [Chelativorans sp.]
MCRETAVSWALFLFKAFCASVIFMATVFTVYTVGPKMETRYHPVVSKLRILSLTSNDDGYAVILAEFTKLRVLRIYRDRLVPGKSRFRFRACACDPLTTGG